MVIFSSLGVVWRGMSRSLVGSALVAPVLAARVALASVALAGVAALPAPAMAQSSARDAPAEAFVDANARRVLGVLNDRHLDVAERREAFHVLINELVDFPRLTRFVLGKYARTASPEQLQRFAAAYHTYAEGVYQRRINDYRANKAVVTGSVTRKPGDVVVVTSLSGGELQQPLDLSWRVLGEPGGWRVVDVQVKGVWLAITQQQDFISTIDNAGGKIDVLTNQLLQDAQNRR